MELNPTHLSILAFIADTLGIPCIAQTLSYHVLMLPDLMYENLFSHLAATLQMNKHLVLELFADVAVNHLTARPQPVKTYNLVGNRPRTQSQQSIAFQNRFANGLQMVLGVNTTDYRELCLEVNWLNSREKTNLWYELSLVIAEKKPTQLREYFQNSFQRFMHQEYINKEDKVILKNLINEMKDKKPAVIAEKFMEMTADRNYFKRNVVMYVVNMKNK
ncbi:Hypothetical_protein [Hexamita inflata]|uniref:Hypothetical_protein n=1 Tax=Hexamita inflata TaxID=28002 RepID=A0ABP1JZM4_9EUKA